MLNDTLNNTRVDIGSDKDWSISNYGEQRLTTSDGKEYVTQTAKFYYNRYGAADTENTLNLPKKRMEPNIQSSLWTQSNNMWSWLL